MVENFRMSDHKSLCRKLCKTYFKFWVNIRSYSQNVALEESVRQKNTCLRIPILQFRSKRLIIYNNDYVVYELNISRNLLKNLVVIFLVGWFFDSIKTVHVVLKKFMIIFTYRMKDWNFFVNPFSRGYVNLIWGLNFTYPNSSRTEN